jgi:hypothetical protein
MMQVMKDIAGVELPETLLKIDTGNLPTTAVSTNGDEKIAT